jgi:organic hydroperoxide reductase OsmC/OhrA
MHTSFSDIEVESVGTMAESSNGIWSFAKIELKAKVTIDDKSQMDKIQRAIEIAHKTCPVANSLNCPTLLDYTIVVG